MAMKPCKECGKEVSTSAPTCPNCGKKHPTGGLTRPAKMFIGIVLFFIIVSNIGKCSRQKVEKIINSKIPPATAIAEVEKHYKQNHIGMGKISGIRTEGLAIKVKVLLPLATQIMADPIPAQQSMLKQVCCPSGSASLWKGIEGYRVVIEASTLNGAVFSDVECN